MQLKVKPYNPWKTRVIWVLLLLAVSAGSVSLFDYGRYMAGYDSAEAGEELDRFQYQQQQLEDEITQLREKKAQVERAAQIEGEAYSELDTTLKDLQAEIIELKEELAFYRGIVSPRDASRGLHLQSFGLEHNGTRSYRYKVVLTQVLKNDKLASGRVLLQIEGLLNNAPKTLGLKSLTRVNGEKSVKELSYRFKYFQNLEGDLHLPSGFRPLRASVQILPRGRKQKMIEKTIDWPTEEKRKDVG